MTNQSPAEALRQQITKELQRTDGIFQFAAIHGQEWKGGNLVDPIMELVTAYAATVEREGRADELKQLPGIRYTDNKGIEIEERYISYSHYVARLATLQGPIQGE